MVELPIHMFGDEILVEDRLYRLPDTAMTALAEQRYPLTRLQYLSRLIYAEFHTRRPFVEKEKGLRTIYDYPDPHLIKILHYCNKGRGWIDHSWTLQEYLGGDRYLAHHAVNGLNISVPANRIADSSGLRPGARTGLIRAKGHVYKSPGYYLATSNSGPPQVKPGGRLVRLYVNTNVLGACRLMVDLTLFASQVDARTQFKVVNHLEGYGRADAAVLYLAEADFEQHAHALRGIFQRNEDCFTARTSYFCRTFSMGVGVAFVGEDSQGSTRSFGEQTAERVARTLLGLRESLPEATRISSNP